MSERLFPCQSRLIRSLPRRCLSMRVKNRSWPLRARRRFWLSFHVNAKMIIFTVAQLNDRSVMFLAELRHCGVYLLEGFLAFWGFWGFKLALRVSVTTWLCPKLWFRRDNSLKTTSNKTAFAIRLHQYTIHIVCPFEVTVTTKTKVIVAGVSVSSDFGCVNTPPVPLFRRKTYVES